MTPGLPVSAVVEVAGGLVVLIVGAERFVVGAAGLARDLGVSTLVVGLTVVAFATSAPEMLVSATASWQGNPGLAVGNALGSNIANLGLVLGISALLRPLRVDVGVRRRQLPALLLVTLVSGGLLWDGGLARSDGVMLLLGLAGLLAWTVYSARRSVIPMLPPTRAIEPPAGISPGAALGWLGVGALALLLGARTLVDEAVELASVLGIGDLVMGLSIVAIGTSLPELAASVAGVLKREQGLALGNVLGSNLFNLLAILGVSGTIRPSDLSTEVWSRDFPVMLGMTLAAALMVYGLLGGHGLVTRLEGGLLLLAYGGYLAWLYQTVA